MDDRLRALFHELAGLPPQERERILQERQIPPELRSEVESLLRFDSSSDRKLAAQIALAAEEAFSDGDGQANSNCGPYRLLRLLGSGGMGAVYLAERTDGEIQQQVAVKVLCWGADLPARRERFLRERQLLASLNHPSIARFLDAGHTGEGKPYLVMEHVDGAPIDVHAEGKDLQEKLRMFLDVCEAVAHAHRHLIVHRDLKPSNILVDASGQVKLLDFGIAKLLDETGEPTQTVERLLTPSYASPEQLCGPAQTTATDVYSLGAVLYKLVTGQSPHECDGGKGKPLDVITGAKEIAPASRLNPDLPDDIDYILRKALRREPAERYASVESLANDVQAFLESRPVAARSGNAWYRTRKFVRRYRVQVAAATVAVAALAAGLYVADRERTIAQRRFDQVRRLANKVLALDGVIARLPGSTKARHEIVAMSKEYLETLAPEARADLDLALEIGVAYSLLAHAQGVPSAPNLGQLAEAEQSLREAEALIDRVLAASPQNRKALLASAEVSEGRMILADTAGRKEEAQAHARRAEANLDSLVRTGEASETEIGNAAKIFINIALAHKNMHLLEDAIRHARRSVEMMRNLNPGEGDLALASALSVLADSLRFSGDLEGALEVIREARAKLDKTGHPDSMQNLANWFSILWREGVILGGSGGINLNRPAEALVPLQRAFDLIETAAQNDPNEASSRVLFASGGRELGRLLSRGSPQRALKVYDHALRRLGEVNNNTRARRGEAELLADSSYPLHGLKRTEEAKERIDAAFRLLRETKDYPADRIHPGREVESAFRALANHYALTGEPERAAEVYEELLDKIMASGPKPQDDLRDAANLSQIYEALAKLDRSNSRPELTRAVSRRRRDLWEHWSRKLPDNTFVRRQLQAAAQN